MADRTQWAVRCRDEQGRRRHLFVQASQDGVWVTGDGDGWVLLHMLEVGRLRAALRRALIVGAEHR